MRFVCTMKPILFLYLWAIPMFQFFQIHTQAFQFDSFQLLPKRSLLRSINEESSREYGIDLNSSNFDQILKEANTPSAIVEFFAHWCPACRHYKPQYEKVARLFNGPDAVHSGLILMARVDCALKINTKLCDRFSVMSYPMLFWGPPSEFLSGRWQPKLEGSKIEVINDVRTADKLLNWINKKISRTFSLDDVKGGKDLLLVGSAADVGKISEALFDVEEATANVFDIIVEHKQQLIRPDTHASLLQFLQVLVVHHPSKRCRNGSAEILVNFDDFWPSDILAATKQKDHIPYPSDVINNFKICGKEVPRGNWVFCQGSKNETRGFSCGLWVLMHSLSVRIGNGESQFAFTTICEFIHNFFICEECREHFYKMCSSVSSPFNTTQDLALWLWKAHNKVNERLKLEEAASGTGDPKYPKTIWPSKNLCPSCYLSAPMNEKDQVEVTWNETEVFSFLRNYYGKMMKSSSDSDALMIKRTDQQVQNNLVSSNAVAVPVGAALAIAIASCAFGAFACVWRSQQKSRKYSHHLHPLKNI